MMFMMVYENAKMFMIVHKNVIEKQQQQQQQQSPS